MRGGAKKLWEKHTWRGKIWKMGVLLLCEGEKFEAGKSHTLGMYDFAVQEQFRNGQMPGTAEKKNDTVSTLRYRQLPSGYAGRKLVVGIYHIPVRD